jgi:S-adenosylmethionine hydrolase
MPKIKPIITLLSDFGTADPYVGEMKAVILSIQRDVIIVDISHKVRRFDINMGAFILAQATPYFPKGTIHVTVVDPSVGTNRKPIIVSTPTKFYVGPDNGVLMLSVLREEKYRVYEILNPKYILKDKSMTFHGRDVFCPAAAYLAKGVSPSSFGPEIKEPVVINFPKPIFNKKILQGKVIHIDYFGNVITNFTINNLEVLGLKKGTKFKLEYKNTKLSIKFCNSYNEVKPKIPLAVIGGTGFLELSVNKGNASELLNSEIGDILFIKI